MSKDFDKIGKGCAIDKTTSVWKRGNLKKSGQIKLGNNVTIFPFCRFVVTSLDENNHSGIIIGDGSYINSHCFLSGEGGLTIGKKCLIAPGVKFVSAGHQVNDINGLYHTPVISKKILIGDNVWIGAGAIIMGGVKIGEGSVIGAGSVVTKDTIPYSVNYGVPSRFIRFRKHQISILDKFLYFFKFKK